MNALAPLESLFDMEQRGYDLPLPPALSTLYGRLSFPSHPGRPRVVGNFVTTLDGVVALNEPGNAGGGDISGFNQHDQLVMGLLRALADAVIVGAGTLRSVPQHRWTAQHIYPPLTDAYQQLRISLGKSAPPLNVIVTARGEVSLDLPVFQSGEVAVLLAGELRPSGHWSASLRRAKACIAPPLPSNGLLSQYPRQSEVREGAAGAEPGDRGYPVAL